MKKILFLISTIEFGGGAERALSILTNSLLSKYKIFLIVFKDAKNEYPIKTKFFSLNENKTKLDKFLSRFKINLILRPLRLYKLIKSIRPDLIISFLDLTNVNIIITKLFFRIRIPLIISTRCNPLRAYKTRIRWINFLIRRLYPLKCVNKIVSVSKGVKTILENYYLIHESKLVVIYNGINLENIDKLKNEKIIKYNEIFNDINLIKLITMGRLSKVKGHLNLIQAFQKIRKQIKNSKLFILGEGPLRKELQQFIMKNNLNNDIILTGLVKNPFKYLAKSDIFIFSSLYEGFPNVLLEALACKLPIISTNCIAGPQEILDSGKYGLLAEVMDTEDLAEKIIYLAKNPDLMKKFSELSFQRAKFFDLQKFLRNWINLIESFNK